MLLEDAAAVVCDVDDVDGHVGAADVCDEVNVVVCGADVGAVGGLSDQLV